MGTWHGRIVYIIVYCVFQCIYIIHILYVLKAGLTVTACMHSELDLLMVTVHDGMCMLKVSTKSSRDITMPHTALILSPPGKILRYIKYFKLAAGHKMSPISLQPSLCVFVLNIGPGSLSRLQTLYTLSSECEPCCVRLCTGIVCSAAQTFNHSKKN